MEVLAGQHELGWCFHPLDYVGGDGVVPTGRMGRVDAREAMRHGDDHGAFAPATSGLAFTRTLLDRILPMPEEFRVVASLYFMEDLSYQEIADIVGVPVGTVRSRLHRARRLLQRHLWQAALDNGIVAQIDARRQ